MFPSFTSYNTVSLSRLSSFSPKSDTIMQVFQIKLKYHCSKPIKLQKFFMCYSLYIKVGVKYYFSSASDWTRGR